MTSPLLTLLIPVVTIVGLIVLTALGNVPAAVGVPAILAVAGVHTAGVATGKLPSPGGKS